MSILSDITILVIYNFQLQYSIMGKVKNTPRNSSPIALRTRSKRCTTTSGEIMKKKNINLNCKVRLVRLTANQIMAALSIDKKKEEVSSSNKYNLRNKNCTSAKTLKTIKKSITSNVVALPQDMTVSRLWSFLKKQNTKPPAINDCCLAKMKKYSPWPSMILNINGKTTEVYFFGEGTTGKVQTSEIVPYESCLALIKKYLKLKGYSRAIRELELMQNIPQHLSILKDC